MEKNRGFTRVYKASVYSFMGLLAAFRYEAAFRQELVLACLIIPLAFFLPVENLERVVMVSAVVLVLVVELLNSAIEAVVDRVGLEQNELAGRAKDMGSAAVFVSILLCVFVWGAILLL